ncbi:LOW QUALITY PROTEIN: synaptopodin 2-like protein [Tachyglossus aculeatus]|uniref:LOW QUALITY PROTEIN: synaptopodin 2-like protein n=1 Tax=Tachyglossus aculeatus TaxID=9261 RepID=UPI0018F7469A|nr:LOW QUALITY PROTEIN: synaptopodin 2-like protein [Tachyglossus aculeatus]
MGNEEEVLVRLSGGAPWGFRLQGGAEQKKPLQVSKIRRRSQAGRSGLREEDQLLSINGMTCADLSHASAMSLIDASGTSLLLVVKRSGGADPARSPSPGELRVLSPQTPLSPEPTGAPAAQQPQPSSLQSPPSSEAYYGETDSDADGPRAQEKPRRPRRRGAPRSTPLDQISSWDSPAEPAPPTPTSPTPGGGRGSSPGWDRAGLLKPPPSEASLLPQAPPLSGAVLIPMVGPVPYPVADELTTSYVQKAKQAKLQHAESVQEKNVKEAKTKCRTIASLLTDAPNPHSKGVLMFKKRRQRAKKYTLVSFGAGAGAGAGPGAAEEEEEDGVQPTSESELDEEAFSDARSMTNQLDWDSAYLDMAPPRPESAGGQSGGRVLSEASGRGAQLFEQQRQRASWSSQEQLPTPARPEDVPPGPPALLNGQSPPPPRAQSTPPGATVPPRGPSPAPGPVPGPSPLPLEGLAFTSTSGLFNRSARPFSLGGPAQRPVTSSVVFRPLGPKKIVESPGPAPPPFLSPSPAGPSSAPTSLTPTSIGGPDPAPTSLASPSPGGPGPAAPFSSAGASCPTPGPVLATTSLYIPAPGRPVTPLGAGKAPEPRSSPGTTSTAMTSTASIFLSAPSRPGARPQLPTVTPTPQRAPDSSPAPALQRSGGPEAPSPREQRIAVPAARTGILQEARRRGARKQMFRPGGEEKKNSPNPELLSLVQNLDEKPRAEPAGAGSRAGNGPGAGSRAGSGAGGAESGPEEDFLSLGAEACNFMQSPRARGLKTPPPVAPKPSPQRPPDRLVNGAVPPVPAPEGPRLQGRGGDLFARRQSRMDRYVVEATPGLRARPRSPSPTPSLPSSWKYSPNIRAPPPIAYNPLHSPFFPLAARPQPSKAETKGPKAATIKQGIKAIDSMRHQPYQLKAAMFCFDEAPLAGPTPGSQGPPKTARACEIRRFSTPAPQPTAEPLVPIVLTPRAATTLDEPIWRAEMLPENPRSPSALGPTSPQEFSRPPDPGRGTSPNPSTSGFQVARPRFSAARIGMQANVWRPGAGHQ